MKKLQKNSLKRFYLIAAIAIFITGCKKESSSVIQESSAVEQITTTQGPKVTLCHGKAQSFVERDSHGNPTCIGFLFSEDALANLPDKDTMTPVPAPANNGTLVDHISVDWNVHGHEPAAIYGKPHFDIHFYMISMAEQNKIVMGPEMEVLPAAEFIPPNYQSIPGGVPMMGKHWADVTAKEFNGQPFDHTFIYGSYNGKFIFYEPMVTLAFLQSKKNFKGDIKQPAKVQRKGYYPKTYSVRYDAVKKIYTVSLNDLTWRDI
jgi:hypothetical protein